MSVLTDAAVLTDTAVLDRPTLESAAAAAAPRGAASCDDVDDRVLVTGLGVLAPNGGDAEEYWAALLAGRGGIRPLEGHGPGRGPTRLAGRITDVDPADRLPSRLLPQTDRVTRLALVAADSALRAAGVPLGALPEYTAGVVTSNATGGFEFTHRELRKLWTAGPGSVSVYESFAWFYAANTGQIAIRHRMRGPGGVVVAEQAGGLDALGHARRALHRGSALMVAGGMESSLDPWGWVAHGAAGGLDPEGDPDRVYRPFDRSAAGSVPGEGGAYLVLERADAARARGSVSAYGEIAGYAAGFDPAPHTGRPPVLRRVAAEAIADAGLEPGDIDLVVADAAGTAELDRAEADAITRLFGPYGVPVTAPKALIGRLGAGGPPLDVVAALLALRDGVIPATAKTVAVPAGYRLDLVLGAPRRVRADAALVLARGRGGFNSALVVRAAQPMT